MRLPFRDGEREVPEHISLWLTDIDTARLTFEEALVEMNHKLERDYINRKATSFVMGHFREQNRES